MKIGVIFYHKNIKSIYRWDWIEKCVKSILNQSHVDFRIYEVNYGGDGFSAISQIGTDKEFNFYNRDFANHAEAMNFLFNECIKDNIDVVFNTNMDDFYHEDRIKTQLEKIQEGYDLVASNFNHVDESGSPIRSMNMSILNIEDELKKDHNLIAHPVVCYSREFIKNNRYNIDDIPKEDFNLWLKTVNDYKFFICDEYLLNYRIHNSQITATKKETIQENNYIRNRQSNIDRCLCGEPKNKVQYNFCQKCHRLY